MNIKNLIAAGLVSLLSLNAVQADNHEQYSGWNLNLGGGYYFYEGDEELNSGQIYTLGAGYDFNNRWTLESSYAYLPNLDRNTTHRSPGLENLAPDETRAHQLNANMLFHLNGDPASAFDPFVGPTAGLMYYENTLENDQQWDPYVGLAAGATYYVTKGLGIRADYRLVTVGHDNEWNQQAMASLTYSWGKRAKAVEAAEDNSMSGGKRNPNLKTIYFGFDSSQLTSQAKSTLKENADYLAKVPGSKIILEGHCDERGTDEYNLALGERRSRSAFEYLRSLGVAKDRMSTVSYGESRPAEAGHNEAAWSKNRRVECLEMSK